MGNFYAEPRLLTGAVLCCKQNTSRRGAKKENKADEGLLILEKE